MERVGVLLLNLGGPDSLDAVKPFLLNLFNDREIIRLPGGRIGQALLSRLIVRSRLKDVLKNYAYIGGRSPILELTNRQAGEMERQLARLGVDAVVRPAMRYWRPFTEEALAEMSGLGVHRLVALTLYPHYSMASTGSSVNELNRVVERDHRGEFEVTKITQWPELPGYLDALALRVRDALERVPDDRRDRTVLLFSAHGLPVDFIERGDPYVEHVTATMNGVLERLDERRSLLAYQSRVGPVKWLEPTTPDTLRALASEGVRDVVIVPISFVTDHIETLEEIGRQFAELARELGYVTFVRTEALNDDPAFIGALANLVRERLPTGASGEPGSE